MKEDYYSEGFRVVRGWGLLEIIVLISETYCNNPENLNIEDLAGNLRWVWLSCPTHMRHVAILGDSRDLDPKMTSVFKYYNIIN